MLKLLGQSVVWHVGYMTSSAKLGFYQGSRDAWEARMRTSVSGILSCQSVSISFLSLVITFPSLLFVDGPRLASVEQG